MSALTSTADKECNFTVPARNTAELDFLGNWGDELFLGGNIFIRTTSLHFSCQLLRFRQKVQIAVNEGLTNVFPVWFALSLLNLQATSRYYLILKRTMISRGARKAQTMMRETLKTCAARLLKNPGSVEVLSIHHESCIWVCFLTQRWSVP